MVAEKRQGPGCGTDCSRLYSFSGLGNLLSDLLWFPISQYLLRQSSELCTIWARSLGGPELFPLHTEIRPDHLGSHPGRVRCGDLVSGKTWDFSDYWYCSLPGLYSSNWRGFYGRPLP